MFFQFMRDPNPFRRFLGPRQLPSRGQSTAQITAGQVEINEAWKPASVHLENRSEERFNKLSPTLKSMVSFFISIKDASKALDLKFKRKTFHFSDK